MFIWCNLRIAFSCHATFIQAFIIIIIITIIVVVVVEGSKKW
jgi:hypothetical protein